MEGFQQFLVQPEALDEILASLEAGAPAHLPAVI